MSITKKVHSTAYMHVFLDKGQIRQDLQLSFYIQSYETRVSEEIILRDLYCKFI